MSDTADMQAHSQPPGLLPHVCRLLTPWWSAHADRLATLLEAAVNAGPAMVELGGRRLTFERLTEMARYAVEMVENLEAVEKSRTCT